MAERSVTITRRSCGDITIDRSVPEGSPSPVYFAESHGRNPDVEFAAPKARSMGEMVGWWIDAFDDGAWAYDRAADHWLYRPGRVGRDREPLV